MGFIINIAGYANMNTDDNRWCCKQESVFIIDSCGMHQIFNQLKEKLYNESKCYLSLLYISREYILSCPYEKELEYLEKRFPTRLFFNIIKLTDVLTFDSSILEVIINCSFIENQQFIVSGEQDFANQVVDQLLFLSINKNKIDIQVINK